MKPMIQLAARLYPAQWRTRYGTEFGALLDDVNPGWRELFDVLKGAIKMRLTNGQTYLKFAAAFGLFGTAAAIATSFIVPKHYVSTAVLRVTGQQPVFNPIPISLAESEVLSRTNLSRIIQKPDLNLYTSERKRISLEHVIVDMRRNIQIEVIRNAQGAEAFSITFQYFDQRKSQAVVAALVEDFATAFEHHRAINEHMPGAVPVHQNLEVLDPPRVQKTAVGPNRPLIILIGMAAGLALGLLVASFVKHTRPTLVFATLGLAGCIIGTAISLYMPQRYVSQASLRIVPYDRTVGTQEGSEWLLRNAKKVAAQLNDPNLSFQIAPLDTAKDEASTVLQLQYANSNAQQAQATLMNVLKGILSESRASIQTSDRPRSELRQGVVECVDNASLPNFSVARNRIIAPWTGLALGLIAALLILNARRASVRLSTEPNE